MTPSCSGGNCRARSVASDVAEISIWQRQTGAVSYQNIGYFLKCGDVPSARTALVMASLTVDSCASCSRMRGKIFSAQKREARSPAWPSKMPKQPLAELVYPLSVSLSTTLPPMKYASCWVSKIASEISTGLQRTKFEVYCMKRTYLLVEFAAAVGGDADRYVVQVIGLELLGGGADSRELVGFGGRGLFPFVVELDSGHG
ncbi:hypothetical protein F441_08720 [Phytophthora nicotianae CJ01A1]|uniref:Uncharacterized protein n=2 Tax=Phytophthora nicotianae TaxID=4792 RepID=W2GV98_PHYNI|nr:hypothetical protein L915_08571 [Phytophthora nicotianae]ETL40295.1 hypothetical protein L916_08501 [Phytophthora nicotianae]ETL93443.1 hypothetical protein L917_08400 [Phytophthora nicotianae]ETP16737.1 hypothetical protein F441_08720 [Phytophthora nicotianae CJ01A1]